MSWLSQPDPKECRGRGNQDKGGGAGPMAIQATRSGPCLLTGTGRAGQAVRKPGNPDLLIGSEPNLGVCGTVSA
jgi:hypothetical protein